MAAGSVFSGLVSMATSRWPQRPRAGPPPPSASSSPSGSWWLQGCVCVCRCVSCAVAAALSCAAACWTRWAEPSRTECPCRAWARRPACTGWTASPRRSRRRTWGEEAGGAETASRRGRGRGRGLLPVMPYKLHVVALVALLDAVDADGVPVRGVAGVTPGEGHSSWSEWGRGPGGRGRGQATCRSRAWGSWCSWRSCRDTGLGSPPSQWRPGC